MEETSNYKIIEEPRVLIPDIEQLKREGKIEFEKTNVVFLDIDGVLNGYGFWTHFFIKFFEFIHLREFGRKLMHKYDIFGIREYLVRRLAKIVHATNAEVVISSSWRGSWFKYEDDHERNVRWHRLMHKYNIKVIDVTPRVRNANRGEEILQWLAKYEYRVKNFVILDDEEFDIKDLFADQLVRTSEKDNVRGHWTERTGLKPKHVRQAIKILQKERM